MVEATFHNFPALFSHLIKKGLTHIGVLQAQVCCPGQCPKPKELNVGNYWHYVTLFWKVLHTHVPLFLEGQRSGVLSHWPQTKHNLKGWNDPRKGGAAVIWTFLSNDLVWRFVKRSKFFFFSFSVEGWSTLGYHHNRASVKGCIQRILINAMHFFFLLDTH